MNLAGLPLGKATNYSAIFLLNELCVRLTGRWAVSCFIITLQRGSNTEFVPRFYSHKSGEQFTAHALSWLISLHLENLQNERINFTNLLIRWSRFHRIGIEVSSSDQHSHVV